MLRSVLFYLCALPLAAYTQTSVDALGGASDAGQRMFDGRGAAPAKLDTSHVYDPDEVMMQPAYPGSEPALMKVLTSPQGCPSPASTDGCSTTRVVVSFIVERDGLATQHAITDSGCPELESTALCALKNMGRWTPGELHDVPVRVRMTIPVIYELR